MDLIIINGNGGNDHDVAAHRAGCQDVAKATRGHDFFKESHATKRDAWLDYNSDFLDEDETGGWDIHFHNCTAGLPSGGKFNV